MLRSSRGAQVLKIWRPLDGQTGSDAGTGVGAVGPHADNFFEKRGYEDAAVVAGFVDQPVTAPAERQSLAVPGRYGFRIARVEAGAVYLSHIAAPIPNHVGRHAIPFTSLNTLPWCDSQCKCPLTKSRYPLHQDVAGEVPASYRMCFEGCSASQDTLSKASNGPPPAEILHVQSEGTAWLPLYRFK